jgi:hypothetical protein
MRVHDGKAEAQKIKDRATRGPKVIPPFGADQQLRMTAFENRKAARPKWAPRVSTPGRSPLSSSSSSGSSSGSFPPILPSTIPGGAASFPVSTSSPPTGWESVPLPSGPSGFSQASPITIMDTPSDMDVERMLTLYDPDQRRKMEQLARLLADPKNAEDYKALHRQYRQELNLSSSNESNKGSNAWQIVMEAVDNGYDVNQAKLSARDLYLFCKKQGKYKPA